MRMNLSKLWYLLSSVRPWINDQIVSDVPDELAICEFDCRESECSSSKWESCQRRVSKNTALLGHIVRQPERTDGGGDQSSHVFQRRRASSAAKSVASSQGGPDVWTVQGQTRLSLRKEMYVLKGVGA